MESKHKEVENLLTRILNNSVVYPHGQVVEIKELAHRIDALKLEIYHDHNPPHFHVKTNCGTIDAMFGLNSCDLLKGKISSDNVRRVKYFYCTGGKELLKKCWDKWNIK